MSTSTGDRSASGRRTIEIQALQARLAEAEATLSAIRNGEVDALVVSGETGERVYTLQGAETPYRDLVENMSEGALTVDSGGIILYANRRFAEMVDQPLERVVGAMLSGFDGGTSLSQLLADMQTSGESRREGTLASAGSGTIPVFASASRATGDESGRVCVIVTDLTSQKRSEALERAEAEARGHRELAERRASELARSNHDLEAFAYAASHDLKEPVRGIANYAQFLMVDCKAQVDEAGQEKLRTIVRLCARMHGLLDALLECARAGRANLTRQPVDLGEVTRESLESIQMLVQEHGAEVSVQADLPCAMCDRVRIGQALMNLVSNGLKYNTSEVKRIEIGSLPAENGFVTIFVRDNGIGIDPRQQERIFGLFRRLHGRDEFGGGMGVGLSLVKTIVEQHGGHVRVESARGVGSTFFMTLPAC